VYDLTCNFTNKSQNCLQIVVTPITDTLHSTGTVILVLSTGWRTWRF